MRLKRFNEEVIFPPNTIKSVELDDNNDISKELSDWFIEWGINEIDEAIQDLKIKGYVIVKDDSNDHENTDIPLYYKRFYRKK